MSSDGRDAADRWTVDAAPPRLLRRGRPAFLLADTVWAAFTGPTVEEWRAHVRLRADQGFTDVLVTAAPIPHDSSAIARWPFARRGDRLDLDQLDPEYFRHAREILAIAADAGLTPVIVVLWNSYFPGTWGARSAPRVVLSAEQTLAFARRCAREFGEFSPIWLISGDDHFDSEEALERYVAIGRLLRQEDPGALLGTHTGSSIRLPDDLVDRLDLDLLVYQSGHHAEPWEANAADHARHYLASATPRPILNLEPPYEGHGRGEGAERHRALDVRRASWLSILNGAGAGLGYGAHGVWSWHRPGDRFGGGAFSGTPFPAEVAARFDGARDAGFVRLLVERHGLWRLHPRTAALVDDRTHAAVGATDDDGTVALHAPHPFDLRLRLAGDYRATVYDLGSRRAGDARIHRDGDLLVLEQPDFLSDALWVLER